MFVIRNNGRPTVCASFGTSTTLYAVDVSEKLPIFKPYGVGRFETKEAATTSVRNFANRWPKLPDESAPCISPAFAYWFGIVEQKFIVRKDMLSGKTEELLAVADMKTGELRPCFHSGTKEVVLSVTAALACPDGIGVYPGEEFLPVHVGQPDSEELELWISQ